MKWPTLTIINFSSLTDVVVNDGVQAINCQIIEDFMPYWGMGRRLEILNSNFDPFNHDSLEPEPIQAKSIIYLVDEASIMNVLAYHDLNAHDIPAGFVFVVPRNWTFALSHEVLESIVNPNANILLPGRDLIHEGRENEWILYSYEVCDPVERLSYIIDDYTVSNFVTPDFFQYDRTCGSRFDFLELVERPLLPSLGSQQGIYNPKQGEWENFIGKHTPRDHTQLLRNLTYDREMPIQPSDTRLASLFERYNQKPFNGCHGLHNLLGISRLSRYKALVERLRLNLIEYR